MLYHKIDQETGLFIEDCIFDKPPMIGKLVAKRRWELINEAPLEVSYVETEYTPDPQYIETEVPQGFYHPKWSGENWVEGGKAPDPAPVPPTDSERLDALEAAMLEMILGGTE